MTHRPRRLCVYCGSSPGRDPLFREQAGSLGALLAARGIGVVYGGGNIGLMGALAEGALRTGGEVIGVIPRALQEKELGHTGCTELRVVASMHERKQTMAELADGFLALPGGIGTLEELFEVFTWLQLGFHAKPVGLVNLAGFFDPLLTFLDRVRDAQFLRPEHRDCLLADPDPVRLLEKMSAFTAPVLGKWWEGHLRAGEL